MESQASFGGAIRCVVSVSMRTEGWDANTVTHVLGIRAFGTQLLCEQVIGRALRRQSYDLNEEGLFDVEYADVFGIPFDFTAKPVVGGLQPVAVQHVSHSPERHARVLPSNQPWRSRRGSYHPSREIQCNESLSGPAGGRTGSPVAGVSLSPL